MGVNKKLFFVKNTWGGGNLFNFAATCIQSSDLFLSIMLHNCCQTWGKSIRQFQSCIHKQVLLEKSLRPSGLTLSLMKNCGCVQNRNCGNGSGSDTKWTSIPVPQKSNFSWNPKGQHTTGGWTRIWWQTLQEQAKIMWKPWQEAKATASNRVKWHCSVEVIWSKTVVKGIYLACQFQSCRGKTLTHIFAMTWPKTVNTNPIMTRKTAKLENVT